ncbi:hypothetical protein P8452_18459 [Trifolium repens]|nr:hypothetical protein P8452_18459 [Trifolium repens]
MCPTDSTTVIAHGSRNFISISWNWSFLHHLHLPIKNHLQRDKTIKAQEVLP